MSRTRRPCEANRWWRKGCACRFCFARRRAFGRTRQAYMRAYRQRPTARAAARAYARPNRTVYQREWKRARAAAARTVWRCQLCERRNRGPRPCACGAPSWQGAA